MPKMSKKDLEFLRRRFNETYEKPKKMWPLTVGLLVFGVLFIVGLNSFYSVPEGSVGCIFDRFSGWDFQEKGEGLHLKTPFFQTAHKISFRTTTLGLYQGGEGESGVLVPKDKNGINFKADVTLRYRLDPNQACEFIQQKGKSPEPVLFTALRADSTRGVFGQYAQEDVPENRIAIAKEVQAVLQDRLNREVSGELEEHFILVEAVDIRNIQYNDRIEQAIIAKQERRQEAEKQNYILEQAVKEKEIKLVQANATRMAQILEAEGRAQAIVLEAEAKAKGVQMVNDAYQQMPKEYVEVKYAEALKSVASGGNSVVMDLSRFQGGSNIGFLDYNQLMSLPPVRSGGE